MSTIPNLKINRQKVNQKAMQAEVDPLNALQGKCCKVHLKPLLLELKWEWKLVNVVHIFQYKKRLVALVSICNHLKMVKGCRVDTEPCQKAYKNTWNKFKL